MEVRGACGALQGVTSTERAGAGIFGSVASGDVASAPGSSGAMSPWLPRPYLPGSFGSAPLPINLRWVENKVELACSQVAIVETLLHDALASVHCNILCPVWVSVRTRVGILSCPQ
jgi:hypothetical protein